MSHALRAARSWRFQPSRLAYWLSASSPQRRWTSTSQTVPRLAEYAGPPGQDAAELFDVFSAPCPASLMSRFISSEDLAARCTATTAPRATCHADGLWHRSVNVWVVNPRTRQVLLQQRSPHKDTYPNCWDVSVAGHITAGDRSDETARRECEEEIGLRVEPRELRLLFTTISTNSGETAHGTFQCNEYQDVYLAPALLEGGTLEQVLRPGESEVVGLRMMRWEELEEALLRQDAAYTPHTVEYVQALSEVLRQLPVDLLSTNDFKSGSWAGVADEGECSDAGGVLTHAGKVG